MGIDGADISKGTPRKSMNYTPPKRKLSDEKFCSECGKVIKAKAEICPLCGVRQMAPPVFREKIEKNKWIAFTLAFLLGGLGVHKFYLGQVGLGIVYLIFCWTGIPMLIALIEAIIYLCTSEELFTEKYSRAIATQKSGYLAK